MQRYQSYREECVLYLVPTPIGNLEDITLRSLNRLRESDIILAEDTRNTKKLCSHYEVTAQLLSLHEHNENERIEMVADLLKEGKKISLVSDAGMPAISDPGARLVRGLRKQGIHALALPGASAFVSAYAASGIGSSAFYFHGFLEGRGNKRLTELKGLMNLSVPIVMYESVHRIAQLCKDVEQVFGSETPMIIAREISKMYEEYLFGTASELIEVCDTLKGEFVVVINPEIQAETYPDDIVAHFQMLQAKDSQKSEKELIKEVAKTRGVHKSEVYKLIVSLKEDME